MRKTKIYKAAMAIAFAAVVTVVGFQGENPYQRPVVYAASQSASIASVAPTMSITKRTATTATIKIQKVTNATSYKIYRSNSASGTYSLVGTSTGTTYTDKGLSSARAYYYKVKAVSSSATSAYSGAFKLSATLAKTTNLTASSSTSGVSLKWSGVSGASKYKVYRATSSNGTYEYIGSSTTTSYSDTQATSGKQYYYRVRAAKTESGVIYNGVYSSKVAGKYTTTGSSGSGSNSGSSNSGSNSSGSSSNSQSEFVAEVLRLINVERAKEGLSSLSTTTKLGDAAYQRATEIKSVFSHDRPDGSSCFTVLADFGVSYTAAGENIAYGQQTPQAVVTAWMNSSGHRANIMSSKFGKVGIGCYYSNGTYYWTQVFTN